MPLRRERILIEVWYFYYLSNFWWIWLNGFQTYLSELLWVGLEKELATHSRALAWRIPGTAEPGGLPSMGWNRVRHDWSDLAVGGLKKRWRHGHITKFGSYKEGSIIYCDYGIWALDFKKHVQIPALLLTYYVTLANLASLSFDMFNCKLVNIIQLENYGLNEAISVKHFIEAGTYKCPKNNS